MTNVNGNYKDKGWRLGKRIKVAAGKTGNRTDKCTFSPNPKKAA